MPNATLMSFLEENDVPYELIKHDRSITAQEVAESTHIPGRDFAKTVMIKVDGRLAMAVLPATMRVDQERLRGAIGAERVELAAESEFKDVFPDCELGAMPPFGHLFDGMFVFVADSLAAEDEIAFNAGTHTEVVRMRFADFDRLARPMHVDLDGKE